MREHIQSKLNNMASILIDDIIIPGKDDQSGSETIQASYYDEYGNKFTFTLGLNVTPQERVEPSEPTPTTDEQLSLILTKLALLESEVSELKNSYLDSEEETQEEDSG